MDLVQVSCPVAGEFELLTLFSWYAPCRRFPPRTRPALTHSSGLLPSCSCFDAGLYWDLDGCQLCVRGNWAERGCDRAVGHSVCVQCSAPTHLEEIGPCSNRVRAGIDCNVDQGCVGVVCILGGDGSVVGRGALGF